MRHYLKGFEEAAKVCPNVFDEGDLKRAEGAVFLGLSVFLRDSRLVHAQATSALKVAFEGLSKDLADLILANRGEIEVCNLLASLLIPDEAASTLASIFRAKEVVDRIDTYLVTQVFNNEDLDFTAFVDQGVARSIFQEAVGFQLLSTQPQETLNLDHTICILRDAITISKIVCDNEAPKILRQAGVTLSVNENILNTTPVSIFLQRVAQVPGLRFRVISQYPIAFSILKRLLTPSMIQREHEHTQQIANRNKIIIGLSVLSVSLGFAYFRHRRRSNRSQISEMDDLRARTPSDFDPSKRYARDDLPAPRK